MNPRERGFDYKRKAGRRTPVSRLKPANERSGASKCAKAFVAPHPFTRSNTKRAPEREVFLYTENPALDAGFSGYKKRGSLSRLPLNMYSLNYLRFMNGTLSPIMY